MNCKIFYSWQSELSNSTNREFIQDALEKALKNLRQDDYLNVEAVLDRDTQGISESPDTARIIFEKIEQCKIFVCDVSIINQDRKPRPTPNPNVLVELGYAIKTLGEEKIIMVMNTAFGRVEQLPFDLSMRRVITYFMSQENQNWAEERNQLVKNFTGAIWTILKTLEEQTHQEVVASIAEKARVAVEKDLPSQKRLIHEFMQYLTKEMHKLKPDFLRNVPLEDLLLKAIAQTEELVVEFALLSQVIANTENSAAAIALYKAFENFLKRYNRSPDCTANSITINGKPIDFDFYRFMGYELLTIFFSFLIQENCWEIIAELLKTKFKIENYYPEKKEASMMPFTYVFDCYPVLLIDPSRIYADVLNKRHTGERKLAKTVPMEKFMDADCLLLLRALSQKKGYLDFNWHPWSLFYMKHPPWYLSEAKSAEFAKQLFSSLSVKTIGQLRSLVNQAKIKLETNWKEGEVRRISHYKRLRDFNPQEIGSNQYYRSDRRSRQE